MLVNRLLFDFSTRFCPRIRSRTPKQLLQHRRQVDHAGANRAGRLRPLIPPARHLDVPHFRIRPPKSKSSCRPSRTPLPDLSGRRNTRRGLPLQLARAHAARCDALWP